jgi:hypothetical protein
MAGWCISGRGRRWIHVLLLVLVLAFGCSHATAHRRSLQQTTEQTGDLAVNEDAKLKADKTDKPDKPDKPDKIKTASKRRGGFKKDNDAKQYLDDLGPDTVQQILLNAGNLNQPTLEEGRAALEQLMSSSNDMVSAAVSLSNPQPAKHSWQLPLVCTWHPSNLAAYKLHKSLATPAPQHVIVQHRLLLSGCRLPACRLWTPICWGSRHSAHPHHPLPLRCLRQKERQ